MIFGLQFALIFAGYGAVSNLSGHYVKHYAEATDFDLGFYFMIPHLLTFARPIICAQADRNRSHKRMFTWCLFGTALAYLPYIVMPFIVQNCPVVSQEILTKQARFWLLTISHLIGSFCFNGVRAFADATAMNHAKRVDCEYVSFRKWAPIGFGLCGFLFGMINQGSSWLPDYVPAMMLFCLCMFVLGFLVYLWPDEYFAMATESSVTLDNENENSGSSNKKTLEHLNSLPSNEQTFKMIKTKFWAMFSFSSNKSSESSKAAKLATNKHREATNEKSDLSICQQLSILMLLIRRDFRIPLALVLLVVGGWICRSAQNFVFMHAHKTCHNEGNNICHASTLAGLIIAGFSVFEFVTYLTLEINSRMQYFQLNRIKLIQLAIFSLAVHYYSLAYLAEGVSPYFFLVESLHGLEFALFISTCLNWGFMFASGVEFIIPELIERQIISQDDDLELVKVSLIATMMSCMTLAYDGIGSMLGSLFYGWIIGLYSYSFAWIINASLSLATFLVVLLAVFLGKTLKIRPRIMKLRDEAIRASCC